MSTKQLRSYKITLEPFMTVRCPAAVVRIQGEQSYGGRRRLLVGGVTALRAYQRVGRRNTSRDHLRDRFRATRKELRLAIRRAQEDSWRKPLKLTRGAAGTKL